MKRKNKKKNLCNLSNRIKNQSNPNIDDFVFDVC